MNKRLFFCIGICIAVILGTLILKPWGYFNKSTSIKDDGIVLSSQEKMKYPRPEYIKIGEKDSYGGTILAFDMLDEAFKLCDIVGATPDGRYYLFQIDKYIKVGEEYRDNEKAELVIWDSQRKSIYAKAQGPFAARYIRSCCLAIEKRVVYCGDNSRIWSVDFKTNQCEDILPKYQLLQNYVDYFAYHEGNLFINLCTGESHDKTYTLYRIRSGECCIIKQLRATDSENYAHILGVVEQKQLMCYWNKKYHLMDFEGNIVEEKDGLNCSLRGCISPNGKKIIYSTGKTPIDLVVSDVESGKDTILCPGSPESEFREFGYRFESFWVDNQKVIAVIGIEREHKAESEYDFVLKEYDLSPE